MLPPNQIGQLSVESHARVPGRRIRIASDRRKNFDNRFLFDPCFRRETWSILPNKKMREQIERRSGGGKSDAANGRNIALRCPRATLRVVPTLIVYASEIFETFKRNRQISATLVASERMQFIDHDELTIAKMRRVIFLREHHRQTLRCCDKKMRAFFTKLRAVRLCRVARPQMDRQLPIEAHPDDRRAQVFLDIVSKRPQRRDVNALHSGKDIAPRCPRATQRIVPAFLVQLAKEEIENAKEPGQRFTAPGRRSKQDRLSIQDDRNTEQLRMSECGERLTKPSRQTRMQTRE